MLFTKILFILIMILLFIILFSNFILYVEVNKSSVHAYIYHTYILICVRVNNNFNFVKKIEYENENLKTLKYYQFK